MIESHFNLKLNVFSTQRNSDGKGRPPKLSRLATIDPNQRGSGDQGGGRPPRLGRQQTIDMDGRRSVAAVSYYQNGKQRYAKGEHSGRLPSQQPQGSSSAKISRSLDNLLNTVSCCWVSVVGGGAFGLRIFCFVYAEFGYCLLFFEICNF